jgi:hypothetical protein
MKTKSVLIGIILASISAILFLGLGICLIPSHYIPLSDDALYGVVAQSIVQEGSYSDIYLPGEPPHVIHPPLFSFMWAIILLLFPTSNVLIIRLVILLMGSLSLIIIWFLLPFDRLIKVLITLNIAVNYTFLVNTSNVLSETPYIFFSLLSFLLLTFYRKSLGWVVITGVTITLASLTRSIGVLLSIEILFLLLMSYLHKNKEKCVSLFITLSVFCILFLLWTVPHSLKATDNRIPTHNGALINYWDYFLMGDTISDNPPLTFSIWIHRLIKNATIFVSTIPSLFFYDYHLILSTILQNFNILFLKKFISMSIVVIMCLGVYKLFIMNLGVMYVLASIFIFLNLEVADRLLFPLLPFFYIFFVLGLISLFRDKRIIVVILCVGLILSTFGVVDFYEDQNAKPQNQILSYISSAHWLSKYVKKGDVVMTRYPAAYYLQSGIKSVGFSFTRNSTKIIQEIYEYNVSYVVEDSISPVTVLFLSPTIDTNFELFTPIYFYNDTIIFKVNK